MTSKDLCELPEISINLREKIRTGQSWIRLISLSMKVWLTSLAVFVRKLSQIWLGAIWQDSTAPIHKGSSRCLVVPGAARESSHSPLLPPALDIDHHVAPAPCKLHLEEPHEEPQWGAHCDKATVGLPKATVLHIRVESCEERGMALCPTLGHTLCLEIPRSTFHVSKCLMETASPSSAQSRNS